MDDSMLYRIYNIYLNVLIAVNNVFSTFKNQTPDLSTMAD